MPRFDQSFNGLCEQNLQDTLQLKQRYLDQKTKRPAKPKDKKQQDTIQSSVHVQQKFLKRSAEEHDPGGPADNFEPPVKLQCTTQHGSHQPEGLTKFSVEIVQQLEFTTSAANSQPQQISTNVTVKAHTNASVKSDVASPKSNPSTPGNNKNVNIGNNVDVSNLVECVKQEPNNDFADLEECAAAVEKDAANGGMGFGTITDLIGDDTNDEIFTSPAFKDLISDITSYPEFNFDFEDKNESDLKVEDLKDIPIGDIKATHSPLVQNQNYSPPVFETKNRIPPYSNMDFGKNELSPAAQTLKQMAEQHQHKNQMGLSFNPNNRAPNSRSPYPDFQLGDYGSPNSNSNFHKNSPNFPQADMIKQEMIFQGNEYDMKRKGGIYKQQYSPYGSPSPGSHGSPGYLPRSNAGSNNGSSNNASFSGATPPRPPSGPGGNNSGTTLQINQAQSMHISQQSHGHNIQVSAGQHLHLSGDLKGNVSIATQQGLHFHQNSQSNSTSQAQSNHQNAQNNSQQNPLSAQQQQQQQQQQQSQQQSSNQSNNPSNQSNQHSSSSMLSDNHNMQQNPMQNNMNQSSNMSGIPSNGSMNSGPNNHPSAGNMQGNSAGGGMPGSGSMGMGGNNIPGGMGSSIPGGIGSSMGGSMGPGMMGGMNQHHGMPGSQHMSSQQMGDSYSMTQSQTINFTQQTLRQRNGGVPNPMGGGPVGLGSQMGGPMGPNTMRHMSPMEQQKVLQQQQIFRAQQQAAMQQQQPLMVRPPPPDYKTSAGMMQGMGPRYSTPAGAPPSTMRRMPHQTMPPSGPMMRPHMYMMQQQQHMAARGMYPRQQTPIGSMDSMPQHGSAEWRHMMMAQQQSGNFNPQMRPNFQHQSFNMNSGGMQLQSMQQPQMRSQHGGMGGMGQGQMMSQQGPMAQMSSMNQQMMMQQQQSVVQGNAQMSMTNIHMQQSQSLSVSGQGMHQQQQTMNNQQQLVSSSNSQQQNNMNSQSNELFDMLGIPADNGLTEQDLLNTFASDSFNLNDIGF